MDLTTIILAVVVLLLGRYVGLHMGRTGSPVPLR